MRLRPDTTTLLVNTPHDILIDLFSVERNESIAKYLNFKLSSYDVKTASGTMTWISQILHIYPGAMALFIETQHSGTHFQSCSVIFIERFSIKKDFFVFPLV